jgi:uncharacterized membrane protein YdbT with pleckstrin-like domain
MNEIITEKNYPVQRLWVFKSILGYIVYLLLLIFLIYFLFPYKLGGILKHRMIFYIILIIVFAIVRFMVMILTRANFHYSIEERFLTLEQGILSKQKRHIPYGVIQNIIVKQDLFDRIFGLASLIIENASESGGAFELQNQQVETVGFYGNKVTIPGLTKANAEILKSIILQKMKENPTEDTRSGL